MKLRVVGLDLSLTSTGMSDGFEHRAIQTGPGALGYNGSEPFSGMIDHCAPQDGPLFTVEQRMNYIATDAMSFVRGRIGWAQEACLVAIEGGAFARGSQSRAAEILTGLRYLVRVRLATAGIPFAMVPPATLKAYTTGHGTATKAMMVRAVRERHGIDLSGVTLSHGRYDMADGAALAAMGYDRIGQPLPTEGPPVPRKSLLAVDWPELISDEEEV